MSVPRDKRFRVEASLSLRGYEAYSLADVESHTVLTQRSVIQLSRGHRPREIAIAPARRFAPASAA
jgi:hypothetical protein